MIKISDLVLKLHPWPKLLRNAHKFLLPFLFNVDFEDVYAQANPRNIIEGRRGNRYMYSWNDLVYLVLSGSVLT